MPRPVATALFSTYQHAEFIEESVESVLAQTLPLQIVIADDASEDATFSILDRRLRHYRGPHEVMYFRNPSRLGVGGTANEVMRRASHDIWISFQGDDIALPHKAETLYRAITDDPSVMFVSAAQQIIGQAGPQGTMRLAWAGQTLALQDLRALPPVLGAAMARRRLLFDAFGEIDPRIMPVDWLMLLRGLLCGRVRAVPDVLVHYRRHRGGVSSVITSLDHRERHRLSRARLAGIAPQLAADVSLAIARGWQNDAGVALVTQEIKLLQTKHRFHEAMAQSAWRALPVALQLLSRAQGRRLLRDELRRRWRE